MLFDTHAHFNDNRFNHDRDKAIESAHKSGVAYILNVSYSEPSIGHTLALARKFDYIYAAIGIHPHDSKSMTEALLQRIRALSSENKVVAIGEIGLDYYRNFSPHDVQQHWFIRQIQLARELQLPIIIHSRDANDDVLRILQSEDAGSIGGVMHSYAGNAEMAKKFLALNFYISLSGPVTYRNAQDHAAVAKSVPLDRLLIETDCPYLTPEPHRGKRNDSSYVRLVAQKIAELRGISMEKVAEATTENGKRLFRIGSGSCV